MFPFQGSALHSNVRLTAAWVRTPVFLMFSICVYCNLAPSWALAQTKCRARDLGIPFEGNPGRHNAITDVQGVEVGHCTLISGKGKLQVGKGPVRTGVTAILPRGKKDIPKLWSRWMWSFSV